MSQGDAEAILRAVAANFAVRGRRNGRPLPRSQLGVGAVGRDACLAMLRWAIELAVGAAVDRSDRRLPNGQQLALVGLGPPELLSYRERPNGSRDPDRVEMRIRFGYPTETAGVYREEVLFTVAVHEITGDPNHPEHRVLVSVATTNRNDPHPTLVRDLAPQSRQTNRVVIRTDPATATAPVIQYPSSGTAPGGPARPAAANVPRPSGPELIRDYDAPANAPLRRH
jgi:hypothetical protein